MRIGIEARSLSTKGGGVRTYTIELIKNLVMLYPEHEYFIFYDQKKFKGTFLKAKEVVVSLPHPILRIFWDFFMLPRIAKKYKLDLIHYTKPAMPLKKITPSIVTVYDIIPLLYPKTQTLVQKIYWKIQLPNVVRRADKILTISKASKKDLKKYLSTNPKKVRVIYLAADSRFKKVKDVGLLNKIRRKYNLPKEFILYLGTLEPRKNVRRLIQAYKEVKNSISEKLVIVGKRGWLFNDIFEEVKKSGLGKDVIFTGFVKREDLPYLYNLAELFVFPSLYEGFGLPPLEAMACGCPVIASNVSSLPEVVGDAAIKVNPKSVREISQAILRVLKDAGLKEELAKKGTTRAKRFSWKKVAHITMNEYKKLIS